MASYEGVVGLGEVVFDVDDLEMSCFCSSRLALIFSNPAREYSATRRSKKLVLPSRLMRSMNLNGFFDPYLGG